MLKNWSVQLAAGDRYSAPEQQLLMLCGVVVGHPTFEDGHRIQTSAIVRTRGRSVWTESGSHYQLEGEPTAGYVAWCAENNITIDDESPVQILWTGFADTACTH